LPKKKKKPHRCFFEGKGKAPKRVISPANTNDDDVLQDIDSNVEEEDLGEDSWDEMGREDDEDRFLTVSGKQIERFLKVSGPTKDQEHKQNRLYKVQELYHIFIEACKATFYPSLEVSVDEAVKKFKGRCLFKQYIKGKQVRFGIKIFCLCCSATSYLFNAMFYVGKSDIPTLKKASITQNSVVQLLQPLAGRYHRVYMDNYYTGLPLFKQLSNMEILGIRLG
jgi:hypothetical protein